MSQKLHFALFAHSMVSDWNHGNAHFLRGLMRELVRLGHRVRCYEELSSWSLANLMKHEGARAIEAIDNFRSAYPELDIRFYKSGDESFQQFLEDELRGAGLGCVSRPRVRLFVGAAKSLLRPMSADRAVCASKSLI